ncbi:protein-disulfide reductase DsbD domain-containing protein [Falsirhodobacter sp. 1013]|uniref:protein-disulfide reductase DsbD domain-containing protein n=1 Tax=Falsirhodobacter sp. 1013 TaxID=3417566 RepID=UPI003EBF259A
MIRYALAFLLLPAGAFAQSLPPDLVQARLLPGWQTDRGTRMAAFQIQLASGWKTYWRSPGDAGIPPTFDWKGSTNVRAVHFHWPVPEVFETAGMQTIGYHRELVLPIEVVPADPSRPVHLQARVDMGVCRDVCVPTEVALTADLSGRGAPDPAIRAALAHQPERSRAKATCTIEPTSDGLRVTAHLNVPVQGPEETVVMEPADPSVWAAPATVQRQGGTLTATSDLVASSGQPFGLDRSGLRLTVLGAGRAVEVTGCPAP